MGRDVNIMAPVASAGAVADAPGGASPRVRQFYPKHVHKPIRKDKGPAVCAVCLRRLA